MLFNSFIFVVAFLPAALLLHLAARRFLSQQLHLLTIILLSFVFYCYWEWRYGILILLSTAFNYGLGWWHGTSRHKRSILAFGITVNLLVLGYYKYLDFAIKQVNAVAGTAFEPINVVLPIAMSFFTFQQIAFLVDVHRGQATRIPYLHHLFIVTFFPHLLAGPIVRFKEIVPQLAGFGRGRVISDDLAVGLTLFAAGLFKKVVLADSFAEIANPGFALAAKGGAMGFVDGWTTALAYTFQIYFDFSGYSDMAIGLARMFGLKFPVNFFSPYKAVGFSDFWRRWHISLSLFLRDYLYIPLGGNRKGALRRYANLIITMGLGGLWHGANWTFVVWGLGHGILLVIEEGLRRVSSALGLDRLTSTLPARTVLQFLTFICVVILWVPFRAPDFSTAYAVLQAMASPGVMWGAKPVHGWADNHVAGLLAAGFAITWFAPNMYEFMHRARPALIRSVAALERTWWWKSAQWRPHPIMALIFAVLTLAAFYRMSTSISEFLYFQF